MSRAKFRLLALACAMCGLIVLLGFRLFELQIVEASGLRLARTQNLHGVEWLHASRGRILDARERVLAEDESQFLLRFVYRDFRRGHAFGLLVHTDRLLRDLATVAEANRLPLGLVRGDPLRYTDSSERFEAALRALLELPVATLQGRDSVLSKTMRSILRFYVFQAARLDKRVARLEIPVGRLLDRAAATTPHATIEAALSQGLRAARLAPGEVHVAIVRAFREHAKDLALLARLLGDRLTLPGSTTEVRGAVVNRQGNLFAWLDACDALHERRTRDRLAKHDAALARRRPHFWQRIMDACFPADAEADTEAEGIEDATRPERASKRPSLARRIADALGQGGSERAIENRFELRVALRFRSEYVPVLVRKPVGFADVVALVLGKRERYPGFVVGEELRRRYPSRDRAGQPYRFLGIVRRRALGDERGERGEVVDASLPLQVEVEGDGGEASGLDLARAERTVLRDSIRRRLRSEFRVREGRSNLEYELDSILTGRPGWRALLRDRRGRERFSPSYLAATRGNDVRLTIDLRIQDLALDALRSAGAEMIGERELPLTFGLRANFSLIDVRSGAIRAMAWLPESYHNEVYDVEVPDRQNPNAVHRWESPPGSILKPIFAVEGLLRGAIQKTRFEVCTGKLRRASSRVTCDCRGRWRPPTMRSALRYSCNSYFGQLGLTLGFDGLQSAMQRFGLLQGTENAVRPLGLRINPAGLVPRERRSLLQRSIGYGWRTPPLLVARAYAGLASGVLPSLHLVQAVDGETVDPTDPETLRDVSPALLDSVRLALIEVPLRDGTARRAGLGEDFVAAKTGTAEVRGKRANNAWFAGYLPHDDPRLAFCVTFWACPAGVHGGDYPARALAIFLRALDARPELRRSLLEAR